MTRRRRCPILLRPEPSEQGRSSGCQPTFATKSDSAARRPEALIGSDRHWGPELTVVEGRPDVPSPPPLPRAPSPRTETPGFGRLGEGGGRRCSADATLGGGDPARVLSLAQSAADRFVGPPWNNPAAFGPCFGVPTLRLGSSGTVVWLRFTSDSSSTS